MRLIWSRPALKDLGRIDAYLESHDPRAAIAALRAINSTAKLLQQFPGTGPTYDGAARYVSVARTPYVLVYVARPDQIEIVRVYDSRQDWRRDIET